MKQPGSGEIAIRPLEQGAPQQPELHVPKQETKNGLPVMGADDFLRFYETDARAHGETSTTTFDYQGFVRFEGPSYEPGVYYKDVMATNGLLKDGTQEGIHIGTDGIVDYNALMQNHKMTGPQDVGEYDMYITVPGILQRRMGVVCQNDSCYKVEQALENGQEQEEIDHEQSRDKGYIVIRLLLEPREDKEARKKMQFIHSEVVRFIEKVGDLSRVREYVRRLEKMLEGGQNVDELRERLELGTGQSK